MAKNLQELQRLCQEMSGRTLESIAQELGQSVPNSLTRAKGWTGQLVEQFLGASGSSHAQHDFPQLGIELKTIPIDSKRKPLETTYVCTVQSNETSINWHDSWVYRKLQHVLWVPVIAHKSIAKRTIEHPLLWQMPADIEQTLRTDWEELMELLQLGLGKTVTAKFGEYLHIRPKASNSKVLINYVDYQGNRTKIIPKGFYLRTSFTAQVLQTNP